MDNKPSSPQQQRSETSLSSEPEIVDKKKVSLLNKRNTISDSYLLQFASLRDVVKPNVPDDDDDEEEGEGAGDKDQKGSKPKMLCFPQPSTGFFVGKTVKIAASHERKKAFLYELNFFQRVFLTLHRPASSPFSKIFSNVMMVIIIISCVFFVISSDPEIKSVPSSCPNPACENDPVLCPGQTLCEPVEPEWFFSVELTCIIFFTIDYVLRVGIVAFVPPRLSNIVPRSFDGTYQADPYQEDPIFSKPKIVFKYVTDVMNLIDLVAILPFYFGLVTNTQSSVSVIRILRLGRMMRVFKVGKYNMGTRLLAETVKESIPALSLLMFFTLLLVVLFGSLVFFAEGGQYTISEEFPEGAYVRANVLANGKEESPFLSILVSCWWVVVTMTTVGYGDLYPTSTFGRLIGVCCMLIGILALALPIGVMGTSFNRNYAKFHGNIEDSLRTSENASEKLSKAVKDKLGVDDVVYEFNKEVVVRVKDGDEEVGEGGGSSEEDGYEMWDENPSIVKKSGEIELASGSTTVSSSFESNSPDDKKQRVKDQGKNQGQEKMENSESSDQNGDMSESSTNLSPSKLSNKEIRDRLQVLSGEIQFLMRALDDRDEE